MMVVVKYLIQQKVYFGMPMVALLLEMVLKA